ncbi:MAG: hypothetical protein WDO18_19445 [Acidobacteriota bacterium]
MKRKTLYVASAVLMTAGLSFAGSPVGTTGRESESTHARLLLRTVEVLAANAASNADQAEWGSKLEGLSKNAQADYLTQIRDDINDMASRLRTLEGEQDSLAPWEREAIVEAAPLLNDAAANTEQAIQSLKDHPTALPQNTAYANFTDKIQRDCKKTANLIGDYLKLNRAMDKEHQLRQDLDSKAHS